MCNFGWLISLYFNYFKPLYALGSCFKDGDLSNEVICCIAASLSVARRSSAFNPSLINSALTAKVHAIH